jgi:hypothetical protein
MNYPIFGDSPRPVDWLGVHALGLCRTIVNAPVDEKGRTGRTERERRFYPVQL